MTELAPIVRANLAGLVAETGCDRLWIAFSGGRDSSVLLHLCAQLAGELSLTLRAIHIDHGLVDDSARWAAHCQQFAAALGVDCRVLKLAGEPAAGDSVEAWAREHRYRLFETMLAPGDSVLTAHHREDQVETIMHRLLSGAGPHGLAAMRPLRRLGQGYLARPLLECSGAALAAYAEARGLVWIDDPSNAERRFLRNRIRNEVLPVLEQAYPGARQGLLRAARIQRGIADHLDETVTSLRATSVMPAGQLALATLRHCAPALRPYLLLRALTDAGLAAPGEHLLHEIFERLCAARVDATPLVRWGDNEVRRYRDCLYFMRTRVFEPIAQPLPWQLGTILELPWGRLSLQPALGAGIARALVEQATLTVAFRAGGERLQPYPRRHTHTLKKLFQEWGVPPWERPLTPLVYIDGALAAVGDQCVVAGFHAAADAAGLVVQWCFTRGDQPAQ